MTGRAVDALFLEVQEALAGEYSLDRELGRGGMGVVYLAREVRLAREVALKVLPPELAASSEMRDQFVREAQMAARLSHPNIVPIHRVGEAGAFVYFAMVYVQGETLGEHIRGRGPMVPEHAIRMLREVAWALTYAHTSGLVHRDVKPDNIMIEHGTGRAMVTDFGIAHSHALDTFANDGRVVGTAHYMSPEQAMGEPVDARSDIYSLGVVAYHTLTGRLPFDGASSQAILAKHISEAPSPIRAIAPAVPHRLANAIECCLAKQADQRFQRASEFAEAIEQSVEPVREIPPAVRVWLAREEKSRVPLGFLAVYGASAAFAAAFAVTESVVAGAGGAMALAAGVLALPSLYNTRRVLRAGYTLADLRDAMVRNWTRRREELAVEASEFAPVTTRAAIGWTVGSAVIGGAVARLGGTSEAAIGAGLSASLIAMVGGAVIVIVRKVRMKRAEVRTPPMVRMWAGKWGERIAKLAGYKLRPVAQQISGPQATEVALGRATDALYAALSGPLKKQFAHVPSTVKRLEAEAATLRSRVKDLEASIASIEGDARLRPAMSASPELTELRADLRRLRDESHTRLATTVAALETIRLGLMRLRLGTGQVESVTGVIDAARGVADDLDRAADAQAEVERLLRATQSHQRS